MHNVCTGVHAASQKGILYFTFRIDLSTFKGSFQEDLKDWLCSIHIVCMDTNYVSFGVQGCCNVGLYHVSSGMHGCCSAGHRGQHVLSKVIFTVPGVLLELSCQAQGT